MSQRTKGRARRADQSRPARTDDRKAGVARLRRSRGQSLVIFAFSITVLLALAGLAVDVIRVYDLYARAERAAEAAALAGVLYMPNFYNSASTAPADGNSATCRAMQEAQRNGFGSGVTCSSPVVASPCPANRASVLVAVCQVPGKITDLQVTVSQSTQLFLLSAIGINSVTVSASAQAEYLPQVQMGSRLNYFGDGAYTLQKFRAVANGQGDLAQFGDPYVDCQESPDLAPPPDSGSFTIYGIGTNKDPTNLQCGAANKASYDSQPAGFSGPATDGSGDPGAHTYSITVGPSDAGATVWIWNPNFIPDNVSSTSVGQLDHFQSGAQATYGALTIQNGRYDDKSLYSNMTYTLYQVSYLYLRSGDVQVSSVTSPPYDMLSGDLAAHGCATDGSQAYDLSKLSSYQVGGPQFGGCVNTSGASKPANFCFQQWCQISPAGGLNLVPAGQPTIYRLAVEVSGVTNTTQGWGSHRYAVEVCSPGITPGTGSPCTAGAGTTVGAWNNMTVFYAIQSSVATFDLGCIPTEFAGRDIQIGLFDPGDASGNVYMQILPPAGSGVTVPVPTGIRTGSGAYSNAIFASNNGDTIYNGLWIDTTITLPSTYTGTCTGASPTGWWTLQYSVTGTPNDTVSVNFNLIGSPVHLVQLG